MHNFLNKPLFLLTIVIFTSNSQTAYGGVTSKLDFGSDSTVGIVQGTRNGGINDGVFLSAPAQKQHIIKIEEQQSPSLETIGIVCVSGGCNTTKTKDEKSKETVSTDVLVHIQTKVDLKDEKNNTKKEENETSDVPVVVGFGGTNGQSKPNTVTPNSVFNSDPLVVMNLHEAFPQTNRRVSVDKVFVPTPHSFLDELPSIEVRPQHRPTYRPTYRPPTDPRYFKNVRYDTNNAIEVQIPYFEPSFNTHYFGEHPPPQFAWHPKVRPVYNPLEYKPVHRPVWSPPLWQQRRPLYQSNSFENTYMGRPQYQQNHVENSGSTCTCPNQGQSSQTTVQVRRAKSVLNINDKLAPLND